MLLTSLSPCILERIRCLSDKWQPEWMPVCKAFKSACDSKNRHILLPLLLEASEFLRFDGSSSKEEYWSGRLKRVTASDHIHIVGADKLGFNPPPSLRSVAKVPAIRSYFNSHHNLFELAESLRSCLETAVRMGLSIESVEMCLIVCVPVGFEKNLYEKYEFEDQLVELLLNVKTLKIQPMVRLRNPQDGFQSFFLYRVLKRVVSKSTSLRKLFLIDASVPRPHPLGAGLLELLWECRRLDELRLMYVSVPPDLSKQFWEFMGRFPVLRLDLMFVEVEKPDGTVFSAETIGLVGGTSTPSMFAGVKTIVMGQLANSRPNPPCDYPFP